MAMSSRTGSMERSGHQVSHRWLNIMYAADTSPQPAAQGLQDTAAGPNATMHVHDNTVRPRLSGPRLSGSLAIRKKIVGYKCTAYAMLTYSMCVRLSGSLAHPDIFVENGCVRLCEV